MLISWDWLKQYVPLDVSHETFTERVMMAGLNHESSERVGDDWAIDLEVTSNRPDCLGHIGVAREAAVLFDVPLQLPQAQPAETATPVADITKVTLQCPQLCPRYTARVIRGVKIGPSPAWLARRLTTIGVALVNNVVDITNYVLFETGQPLHAFDLAHLAGPQIIVRPATAGEKFEAINHKTYELPPNTCVIADARRAVALGGVMGGADSEVSNSTRDLLIESAQFDPVSIRGTARALVLHSPSSYRFERGVDPEGVDWASRRCCELILEIAGGELAAGVIDVGRQPISRKPIRLRFSQLKRVLGIDIPADEARRILTALGNREQAADAEQVTTVPPSWRRDLEREIDLVEEVARIHGYDKIPEDVSVPMAASHRRDEDRVLAIVREVLTAAGYDEAMTASAVEEGGCDAFSPWTSAAPLCTATPVLGRATALRTSLTPSLLAARRTNETLANWPIELFEIAKVYLPRPGQLPAEPRMLAITSGGDYTALKGVVEAMVARLQPAALVEAVDIDAGGDNANGAMLPLLAGSPAARLQIGGQTLGYLGQLNPQGLKQFELRRPTTVAEIRLDELERIARLIPQYAAPSAFPAVDRDVNLEVDASLRWAELAAVAQGSGGQLLESLDFRDIYLDDALRKAGRKSLLFSVRFRAPDRTLTNQEVDEHRDRMIAACAEKLGARLRV